MRMTTFSNIAPDAGNTATTSLNQTYEDGNPVLEVSYVFDTDVETIPWGIDPAIAAELGDSQ